MPIGMKHLFETGVSILGDFPMSTSVEKPAADRLIDVAGEIFAEKGSAATVREICRSANCSVAAINYYFGDKQKLYLRCVQAACEQKQKLFPLPVFGAQAPTPELLRSFLCAMASRIAGNANLSWQNTLMLREMISPSAGVSEMLQERTQRDFEVLDQFLGKLLGPELDSLELRQSFETQILARSMFLRTGKSLRRMFGLDGGNNEDPQAYGNSICDSILMQIDCLRAPNNGRH